MSQLAFEVRDDRRGKAFVAELRKKCRGSVRVPNARLVIGGHDFMMVRIETKVPLYDLRMIVNADAKCALLFQ